MVLVSYLVHYNTLLQNGQVLLKNATKVYYKMRQLYHKMGRLLQNATFFAKCTVHSGRFFSSHFFILIL